MYSWFFPVHQFSRYSPNTVLLTAVLFVAAILKIFKESYKVARKCPMVWGVAKGSSISFMGRERELKFRMQAVKWVVAKLQVDKTASFCRKMSGREDAARYKEINQHHSLPWNFMTHGLLHPSAFPRKRVEYCFESTVLEDRQTR